MANDGGTKGELGKKLAQKALMPVVATAASAVAGVVAKKGPDFFEQNVLPRLKDLANSAGRAAHSAPSRASSAAGSVGDLASDLTDRARGVVGKGEATHTTNGTRLGDGIAPDELERHIEERAKARAERRNASRRR